MEYKKYSLDVSYLTIWNTALRLYTSLRNVYTRARVRARVCCMNARVCVCVCNCLHACVYLRVKRVWVCVGVWIAYLQHSGTFPFVDSVLRYTCFVSRTCVYVCISWCVGVFWCMCVHVLACMFCQLYVRSFCSSLRESVTSKEARATGGPDFER